MTAASNSEASTEIRQMPDFERIYLFCPNGHEVVSAPTTTYTGRLLVAGDFTRESCGSGSCNWTGDMQ